MKYRFKFAENLKIFLSISAILMIIGIVFNFINGVKLDIQFSGGTIVNYTYSGDIDENDLKSAVKDICDRNITTSISKDLTANSKNGYMISVQFPGNEAVTPDYQKNITTKLQEKYPDNKFALNESNSVDPAMGSKFFLKCITAVIIAGIIMTLYVAWRFKKIKGLSAAVMALLALVHDVIIVFFSFVIFKFPIDSNFIAVVLTIIGYSLNDTIVLYDRIRENRAKLGRNVTTNDLYNISANQVLFRTIMTSVTTALAIGSVLAVALVYNLDSVITFALPMLFGVISGCYSSTWIAGPLWVAWQNHKDKKSKDVHKTAKAAK